MLYLNEKKYPSNSVNIINKYHNENYEINIKYAIISYNKKSFLNIFNFFSHLHIFSSHNSKTIFNCRILIHLKNNFFFFFLTLTTY
jgi:hypothetical protein